MKQFTKTVGKIAIPVALQCMLQSSFSIVDQLMIGQLGKNSIAAVGLCSNFMLIFNVVMGAIGTVAGILISQFTGAEDEEEAWSGFTVSSLFGLLVAGLFMTAGIVFAGSILNIYTTDLKTVAEGIPYFRIVSFTFVPMTISTIVATWLRCNEHATIPLVSSFAAVICNTVLNYILIFGKFGFGKLGIKGAGFATTISQMINLLLMVAGFLYCLKRDNRKMQLSVHMKKVSGQEYLAMILPILISEFLWSLGQNVNSAVYGHLSTNDLAAYSLTAPIQGLIIGALSGLSAAAGVIIGKQLGKKEYDEAYTDSKRLMWMGFFGAVIMGAALIVCSGLYVSFYQVEDAIRQIAKLLLIVFALYSPVKVLNMILGGGIIRSGGHTKIIMTIDILGTWLVGIPLCFFAAYVLKLTIVPVYAILSVEEIVRLVITLVMFKKKTWMRSLA
ncbi:MAG: MATE family efflux transporter [Lachnospiraceae bacterium]|nr:MATE family efflux transporter [Lachnospiraceae bacterium]